MDSIELSLFVSRIEAICDEMGAVLRRTAFSPNIKDRLDFSCAVFDENGHLCAQAAHIPVHLGSMAYAMESVVGQMDWAPGDMVILNDPYLGGTHLPDVTLVSPVFITTRLCGFVANRAHHADIGATTPGSMPIATTLEEEGLIIPPTRIMQNGIICKDIENNILGALNNPDNALADFRAQISANRNGTILLQALIERMGVDPFHTALQSLNEYAEKLAREGLQEIPDGNYEFTDFMDDDGQGNQDLSISVKIIVQSSQIDLDFSGTCGQVQGNINCPISVAAAAVFYCFYCLMPAGTPPCAGSFRPLRIHAPAGCLINSKSPAAVAAGNVETSTRLVDVVLGALAKALPDRIPAASHGSMNNVAMGAAGWDYYETLGGGMGAGVCGGGLDGVQTHMTNTYNTPIEVLEMYYPLRISQYAIRTNSGGQGQNKGGNGLIREYHFLSPASVTLLTERRRRPAWGLAGGDTGKIGRNLMNGREIPGKASLQVNNGDILTIQTPGGGAWGII